MSLAQFISSKPVRGEGHCKHGLEFLNIESDTYKDTNRVWTVVLHSEALSTATGTLHIGVIENELASQFCLQIVHFCSKQRQLGLGINEDMSTWGGGGGGTTSIPT